MGTLSKSWVINAALIALAVLLVVYAEVALRNDPHQTAAAFERSVRELLARSVRTGGLARAAYQDEALAALPPNPNIGSFFRLDDRLTEARMTAGSRWLGVPADTGTVFALEFADPAQPGFRSATGNSELDVHDGLLRVVNTGPDHLVSEGRLRIPPTPVGDIKIRIRCDRGTRLALSWSKEGSTENPDASGIYFDIDADGAFHTYSIDATAALEDGIESGDPIVRLFLIPSNQVGANAEIDFIRFESRLAKYSRAPHGVTDEVIGGHWRRALYMKPTQQLTYTLRVPEESPSLDFGVGVLIDDSPMRFEVLVTGPGGNARLFEKVVESAERWEDVGIDLEQWAGKDVELALRVSGSPQNVAFWSSPLVSSAPPELMNVIVILEDSLRADRLSTQGYWRETSPNRTELMKNGGVVFLNAFSQSTKTRSSIPSLMTSLLPTATGVWGLQDSLDESYLTWAEILRSQGFRTAAFIQNGNAGPYAGLQQGFDEVIGAQTIGPAAEEILGGPVLDWLADNTHRNFFLYLHVLDPHGAYDPPPPFDHGYRRLPSVGKRLEHSDRYDPEWLEHPTTEGRRRLYEGEIRHNDSLLPRFLRTLDDLGLRENTLIVLTSDHGEFLGEQGLWDHRPPGLLPVVHVPLMLAYPKRFSGNRKISQNVQLLDVLPTVLELAGVGLDALLMQGDSLLDLIEKRRMPYWNDRIAVSEEPITFADGSPKPSGSLIFRELHLIWSRTFKVRKLAERGGEMETGPRIFDFYGDPDEMDVRDELPRKLSTQYWSAIRELQANNTVVREKLTAGRGERIHRIDPAEVDRFRSLGSMKRSVE